MRFLLPVISLSLAVILQAASAELLQVQVLHRHGARPHLRKVATDPSREQGGAELLPEGVVELRRLGTAVRARYLTNTAETKIANAKTDYSSAQDFYAVSSQTSRTLASSRAFISGLYGAANDTATSSIERIPTHSFASEPLDWRLRGYTMCPKFVNAIEDFLKSDQYKKEERKVSSAGVLQRAGDAIDEKETDLAHAFNIYDRYVLARGDYGNIEPDAAAAKLSSDDFGAVKQAADWMESHKYGDADVAGALVSGGLLNRMVQQSNAMLGESDANVDKSRLVEYSGHYPLLLGAFSALGLDSSRFTDPKSEPAAGASTTIPDFGAALVWELHSAGEVRLFWYRAGESAEFVPIPCGDSATEFSCKLSSISKRLSGAPTSRASFCTNCGSDKNVNSAVCGLRSGAGLDGESSNTSSSSKSRTAVGFGGFAVGLAFGVVAACLYMSCASRRSSRRQTRNAPIQPLEGRDLSGASSEEFVDIAATAHFGGPTPK